MTKSTTLNLRIDPDLKEALKTAASMEHRSIANMVEVMILRHCERNGISIPEQHSLFESDDDSAGSEHGDGQQPGAKS